VGIVEPFVRIIIVTSAKTEATTFYVVTSLNSKEYLPDISGLF
jgi:hypothetical protein